MHAKRVWQSSNVISETASEYENDIWDVREFGIELSPIATSYTLNFTNIPQFWLRIAAKQFIRYSLSTLSFATCQNRLKCIRRFSRFLAQLYPDISVSELSRSIITEYLEDLARSGVSSSSRQKSISYLRIFFELCRQNNWLAIPNRYLFCQGDAPKSKKSLPRYIPEEVLDQLNQHLSILPQPIARMALVLQECGMRISELCLLKFDCLKQDADGDWFLQYEQFKMKQEHIIPISKELAQVIQEQQQYIKENLGVNFAYLFCDRQWAEVGARNINANILSIFSPMPKPMKGNVLAKVLNVLAYEKNICTSAGKRWRFQSHQFRHTVGTRMVNMGVPLHIIQRYLGHVSPEMTLTYAHIHDSTMKQEIAKFQGKVINISGQIVQSQNPELDTSELQWFKRNVLGQVLPNGSCALPVIAGACPHANACLTCSHFRTTIEFLEQHKEQLQQTERLIEKAKANNWLRQAEMNEQVASNLRTLIHSLETTHDN